MVEATVVARRWGNSLGIIIPKEIAEQEEISEGESLVVELKRPHAVREFFGLLSDWKKSPQSIKDEARKGWD